MRKKALKKKYPNRHKMFEIYRKERDGWPKPFNDEEGNTVYLNLKKHFTFQEQYANQGYQLEMMRRAREL